MKITDFKLYRLWWLLFGLPYLAVLVFWYFIPEKVSVIYHLSHLVFVLVAVGVIFYAIGLRTFTRNFWKAFLPFAVIEEHWNIYKELGGAWDTFIIPNIIVSIPFVALYFYAYKRKEIWEIKA